MLKLILAILFASIAATGCDNSFLPDAPGEEIDVAFTRVAYATLPTQTTQRATAWRPGQYIVSLGQSAITPIIRNYDFSSGSLSLMTAPASMPPTAAMNTCAWRPNASRYQVWAHDTTPFITMYDWNSGSPVKMSNPGTLPAGNGYDVGFTPDGRYMAIPHVVSPYVTIYDWNSGSPVKVSNPGTLPQNQGQSVAFSPDSLRLFVGSVYSTQRALLYELSGGVWTFRSGFPNLAGIPYGAGWSPDGTKLAIAVNASPYIQVYNMTVWPPTVFSNPSTLPAGAGNDAKWSPDGRFLAVAHNTSPFITIYDYSTGSPVKVTNPTNLPPYAGNRVAWSYDSRYLSVSSANLDNGIGMTIYENSDAALASPLFVQTSSGKVTISKKAPATPLILRLNSSSINIAVVETSDPNASPLRVSTSAGIKAIRKQ